MTTVKMSAEQLERLQNDVQLELEKREWAEPGDNVMAEYVTVLIANGSDKDRVQAEMDDLVGADFDPGFLTWLFSKASEHHQSQSAAEPEPEPEAAQPDQAPVSHSPVSAQRAPVVPGRMLSNALSSSRQDSYKRKADGDVGVGGQNKKRVSDQGLPPSGPRAMGMGEGGRSLQSRISGRAPMAVRGAARPAPAPMPMPMNFARPPPQMQAQAQAQQFNNFMPGQQEMFAQMFMMQAGMQQMGEMMAQMMEAKQNPAAAPVPAPAPPKAVKLPHGTKLGAHSVSAVPPKASVGPIPTKPTSTSLCKYGVGCTNSRCIYSHPSPAANEQTGMVLTEEVCAAGKDCKDMECVKSHVSPAVVHGGKAGPSRLLCKYQNCTNPSCAFRHEDSEGNPIPPPALHKAPGVTPVRVADASSDNEDGDIEVVMTSKNLLDSALDDSKAAVACRFGERCTRADCKFTHPASRPNPSRGRGGFAGRGERGGAAVIPGAAGGIAGGMSKSKKFGGAPVPTPTPAQTEEPAVPLNPGAGEFVPGQAA